MGYSFQLFLNFIKYVQTKLSVSSYVLTHWGLNKMAFLQMTFQMRFLEKNKNKITSPHLVLALLIFFFGSSNRQEGSICSAIGFVPNTCNRQQAAI